MSEDGAAISDLQRGVSELTAVVRGHIDTTTQNYIFARHEREVLQGNIENISRDLNEVKVNIATMTGKFLGGWRVLVVLGTAAAVVVGWLISLRVISKG